MNKYFILKVNEDFDKNELEENNIKYFMFKGNVENEVYYKEFIKMNSFRICHEELLDILDNENEEYFFVIHYTPKTREDFLRVNAMTCYLFETKKVTLKNKYQLMNDAETCPNNFLHLEEEK